ncbi:MAG: histidine kinase dimerization/phosphoacceptor domain -containing protein [Pseudomonadota bacterium]
MGAIEHLATLQSMAALQVLPLPIVVLNSGGDVTVANPLAEAQFGLTPQSAPNTQKFAAVWQASCDELAALYERIHTSQTWTPFTLHRKSSSEKTPDVAHLCGHTITIATPVGQESAILITSDISAISPETSQLALIEQLSAQLDERHKAQTLLKRLYKREQNFNRELVHRVRNNLSVLAAMLRVAIRDASSRSPLAALLQFEQRMKSVVTVHDLLDGCHQKDQVAADEMIARICADLQVAIGAPNVTLNCITTPKMLVATKVATPLGMLVNEAVTNAYKHAFPEGRAGTITISLTRADEETAQLSIADDGVGFTPGAAAEGLGLRILNSLMEQIGGRQSFNSQNGVAIELSFPVGQT